MTSTGRVHNPNAFMAMTQTWRIFKETSLVCLKNNVKPFQGMPKTVQLLWIKNWRSGPSNANSERYLGFCESNEIPYVLPNCSPLPPVTEVASSGAGREANHWIFEDGWSSLLLSTVGGPILQPRMGGWNFHIHIRSLLFKKSWLVNLSPH